MGEEFERAKSYLQVVDAKGVTLYDHVSALILRLIKDKPDTDTSIRELESLSVSLKSTLHTPQVFKELPSLPQDASSKKQLLETIRFTLESLQSQSFTPESKPVAAPEQVQTKVQDIHELQHLLELAGVQIGASGARGNDEGVLKLHLSIARLVASQAALEAAREKVAGAGDLTLATARFWGIVRGTKRDYYVVEATRARYPLQPTKPVILNAAEIAAQKARRKAAKAALREQKAALQAAADAAEAAGEDPGDEIVTPRPPVGILKEKRIKPIFEKKELAGVGVNEYIYFVSTTLEAGVSTADSRSTEWTQLPDVEPAQIEASKALRRLVTGDLNSAVLGFPVFPGLEASYLRTQIARISAATLISPAGFYTTDETADGREVVQEDGEYAAPENMVDLAASAGWVHHRAHLLRQGRTTVWEEPEKDEEEEEEEEEDDEEEEEEEPEPEADEEEEPDEPLPILSSVEEDLSKGLSSVWSFRCYPKPEHPHAVAVARSLVWPGAVAVTKRARAINIYVGDGQKYLPRGFTPAQPPKILTEFAPVFSVEEEEPNPLQEQMDPLPPEETEKDDEEDDEDEEEDDDDEEEEEEENEGSEEEDA